MNSKQHTYLLYAFVSSCVAAAFLALYASWCIAHYISLDDALTLMYVSDMLVDCMLLRCGIVFDFSVLVAALVGLCTPLYIYIFWLNTQRNFKYLDVHGSAKRGVVSDGLIYKDKKDADNNIILTKNLALALNNTAGVKKTITNLNVMVIGGSGSNKTVGIVEPNILQAADHDLIVIDPKGTTLTRCATDLIRRGVEINVFDTVNKAQSDQFNPLAGIHDFASIMLFSECLINNTAQDGARQGEQIWTDGVKLMLQAILGLLYYWYPNEFTLANVFKLCDKCQVDATDSNPNQKNVLDKIFDQIETGQVIATKTSASSYVRAGVTQQTTPSKMIRRDGVCAGGWFSSKLNDKGVEVFSFNQGLSPDQDESLKRWREFRAGAGKTIASYVTTLHTRLQQINQSSVLDILGKAGHDDMRLESLGQTDQRRCIFIITSDFDGSLSCLLSLFIWQAIYLPMRMVDIKQTQRLPHHLTIIADEFKNVGKLPSFTQCISVVRSRNISIMMMLQSLSQLEEVYGEKEAVVIRENCATLLYLGGSRLSSTAKTISESLGQETIFKKNSSKRGVGLTADNTISCDTIGRSPFTTEEISQLSSSDALVLLGTQSAIQDKKSVVWEHPRYNKRSMFDPSRKPPQDALIFNYSAYKKAGKPTGKEGLTWLEKYSKSIFESQN